jgi:hypothetical protein
VEHLVTDDDLRQADTRLAVVLPASGEGRWDIFLDGWGFAADLPDNEVLPLLATLVFVRSCEALTDRLLFHAAVDERNGVALIFPGEAGSGKTTLRYLSQSLNLFPVSVDGSAKVGALIFPMHTDGTPDRLESIDKMEALQRLAATGSSNRVFTDNDLTCMIDLVESRPCYELVYQDLDQAVALIKKRLLMCG